MTNQNSERDELKNKVSLLTGGWLSVVLAEYDLTPTVGSIAIKTRKINEELCDLIDAYTASKVQEARLDELSRVMSGANYTADKQTPHTSSREINYYDFAFYVFNRSRELKGEKELTPQEWIEHER